MKVSEMRINGNDVEEAKLNGQIVYKKATVAGPVLDIEGLEDGIVISANPQINVSDVIDFTTQVLDGNGNVKVTAQADPPNPATGRDTYYDRFGIGWLGVGVFTVRAVNVAGGITEVTFEVIRP